VPLLQLPDPIAERRRPLELQPLRRRPHLLIQLRDERRDLVFGEESGPLGVRDRREVDANFRRVLGLLFERGDRFAVATHDGAMIERTLELVRAAPRRFEFQMLLGVRDALKDELVAKGHRVLEYIPYGPNWLPYFTRRLRERPRNVFTMVRSFMSG